ncbi:MAG TPA: CRTAC1 family protein [Candidatus Sulfomarinibacteraceae bacterium]|nr:CRTAC1 family protein [Candidatus Sulfomarinibacteraceae bacterium]
MHRSCGHVFVSIAICWAAAGCGRGAESGRVPGRVDRVETSFHAIEGWHAVTDAASTGGVSFVDYDDDGDLDLFVSNGYDVSADDPEPYPNRVYENRAGDLVMARESPLTGDGGFSSGSTWGDYDNDGWSDVFVANQRDQDNLLYRNLGGGGFERVTDQPPAAGGGQSYAASWVDVDNDGLLDLYVANGGMSHQGENFLYRNLGHGGFARITEGALVAEQGATCGISWADYDGDGDQDVFVCDLTGERTGTGGLFRNEGGWQFTRVGPDAVPISGIMATAAAWGDADNDGDLDLYVASAYGLANVLLRNIGGGAFERVAEGDAVLDGGHSYAANWADFDNDGDLDLVVANWGAAPVLYANDGSGRLDRAPGSGLGSTVEYGATVAWGDLDGDGFLDIALGNWPNVRGPGERNRLYRNHGGSGSWVLVDLRGSTSNRSAVGARVEVTARIGGTTTTQVREVSTHAGFRSQNDLRQHVGLGDAGVADGIVVRWPSGRISSLRDVPVNGIVTIREDG